jgi:4-amino-4-deoxy-L-arabinose transferase-like glycosyltransferase
MKREYKLLLLIIILASFLRIFNLGVVPSGFDADEAAFGYNAYSIIKTGRDEYGKFLPIILKSFGEYKPALYAYTAIPFILFFDLTPFAVRFPSALFGVMTIAMIYFFVMKLFNNKNIALISTLIFAISPWHINLSRTASEANLALFFILFMSLGLISFQKYIKLKWLLLVVASGFLALLSYSAAVFFIILILLLFFIINFKKSEARKVILILLLIFFICGGFYSLAGSISRFKQVSIFQNPLTKLIMEEQIREDNKTPVLITRLFHNKVINTSRTILINYTQYFTADFLILNGGYPNRQKIPAAGLLYIWQIPFLLFGTYFIIKRRDKISMLLLGWWFILLIPAAITFDEIPNVYRSIIILPALIILTSVGVFGFFRRINNWKIVFFIFLILLSGYELLYYTHQYFVHQDIHQPWYRGYAYKELVTVLDKLSPQYSKIIITKTNNSPYIYFLFFDKYDPNLYQAQGSPRDLDYQGFSKYIFVPDECPLQEVSKKNELKFGTKGVLYINKGICSYKEKHLALLKTIYWQDHNPAFRIMTYKADKKINNDNTNQE